MTRSLVLLLLLTPALGSAEVGDPFTVESENVIGVSKQNKIFAGIELTVRGTSTQFKPVAKAAPKWRRARVKLRGFVVDTKTPELEAASKKRAEKAKKGSENAFAKVGVVEAKPIAGGFSGRYRLAELGVVVYIENDQLLARTGDITVMKMTPLVKSLNKRAGRCRGTLKHTIVQVSAEPEWKAAAIMLESDCHPTAEDEPSTRTRSLLVADLKSIVEK